MQGTLHLVSGFIPRFYNCITVYSVFASNMSKKLCSFSRLLGYPQQFVRPFFRFRSPEELSALVV